RGVLLRLRDAQDPAHAACSRERRMEADRLHVRIRPRAGGARRGETRIRGLLLQGAGAGGRARATGSQEPDRARKGPLRGHVPPAIMKWPAMNALPGLIPLPTGYHVERLDSTQVPALIAAIREWHPEISVGVGAGFLREEFYRDRVCLDGD